MAFIPKDASWYIAEIVLEIIVSDDPRNVVHINYMLINAASAEEAYDKALHLGSEHESTYSNSDGKAVQVHFRGLRNLNVIYEALEDGAELLYEEELGPTRQRLETLVRPKESLGIFKPIEKSPGPNYASEVVQREAMKLVGQRRTGTKRNGKR